MQARPRDSEWTAPNARELLRRLACNYPLRVQRKSTLKGALRRTARHQRRAGLARAHCHLPAEPGVGAARGRAVIVFLCSDAAEDVNAEAITVALGGTAQKPRYEPLERAASSVIGSERIRLPVAAKTALHSAGAMGGKPGSPTPPNGMS